MDRETLTQAVGFLEGAVGAGLTTTQLAQIMGDVFGGTDAAGAWDWRLAFDLMQAAAARGAPMGGCDPRGQLAALESFARSLPTETRRAERQIRLQQFSTPLPYAHLAATALAVTPGDLVLEPSAGTGTMAMMAKRAGARLALNEIDPMRAEILRLQFGQDVSGHDGEHIADLAKGPRPSAVLMNPPFSSSAARSGDPTIAARHLVSAALHLAPGGRIVSILPERFSPEREPRFWQRLASICVPRMHLTLPGRVYAKLGTSISTVLLVCDKVEGGDDLPFVRAEVDSLGEALEIVLANLPERQTVRSLDLPATPPSPAITVRSRSAQVSGSAPSVIRASNTATPKPAKGSAPIRYRVPDTPKHGAPISPIYAGWVPQRIEIEGAVDHPSPLVESLAMASVVPPVPDAHPILPAKCIVGGELSAAQLETIIMAETAFARDLPGRFTCNDDMTGLMPARDGGETAGMAYRQGAYLGDGTGAGKGRQVAGLILSGWLAGRDRAIWISKSETLIEDARRDWADLGGAPTDIQPLGKWKPHEAISLKRGILFVTYATLRSQGKTGDTRLDQMIAWAGEGFEGVIAFDEAHAMQNAAASKGGDQGRTRKPSQQGIAGLRLQNALPRARVLYVSATGATTVANLAYATRLGIWGFGKEYPFQSREGFISAMEAGGVAAMEVVARDLKALGLYVARALSFEGCEYDLLEHALTPAQIEIYDSYASAFRVIHANLEKALEATGIVDTESGKSAGAAKASAKSRFASTSQRFFAHLLHGMKAGTIIAAIEADIADGWAPVVQIVSTGESLLDRRIEETEGSGDDLTEAHLTPKDVVLDYLMRAFPIHAQEIIEVDGTEVTQPLRHENGELVISREAEALRDALILDIQCLAPIPTFLDQLIWHFGEARVAEVTGRSKRPERDADGALVIRKRSASANASETEAFQNGTKDLLVFSDAGGTGRSYHASIKATNQKRRRHYLVEPGWRADAAIQGLGRTHRSAQVSAPFFRVCTSSVHGEKRFSSTIARRLDTLGALSKGERQTGSQNLFREEDNLESPIARSALRSLYFDLMGGSCPAMSYEQFSDWSGLTLCTREGVPLEDMPPMSRFLNRVLAMPIAMQNALFAELMEKIHTITAMKRQAGTLDLGLETLRAMRIAEKGREDLWTCPRTGAITRLVHLQLTDPVRIKSAEEMLGWIHGMAPFRNAASGKVALISRRPRQVHEDDSVSYLREMIRHGGTKFISEAEFSKSNWEEISKEMFATLWDAEGAALPTEETRDLWLLTGLLLPIWTEIPTANERIYRVTPEGGDPMIGRALGEGSVAALRSKFMTGPCDTPSDILTLARGSSRAIEIGMGLTLTTRRVAGTPRLEITGFARDQVGPLKAMGCFTEIIAHQLRVFIPDRDDAEEILARIMGQAGARAAA